MLTTVYTTGERFVAKELTVTLKRNGRLEQTYIDFVCEAFRKTDYTTDAASITGVTVACVEVTERVLARHKLLKEQNRLNTILAQMPVGVMIASPTGELVYHNERVGQIIRHPLREGDDADFYRKWSLYNPVTSEALGPEDTGDCPDRLRTGRRPAR